MFSSPHCVALANVISRKLCLTFKSKQLPERENTVGVPPDAAAAESIALIKF
jgi:hypothetical protein